MSDQVSSAIRTRRATFLKRPTPWALLGPGIVLLGMSQGSGELWLLPKLHAEHGLDFTWLIFYGSLFQIPILAEAMRTVALTGESPLSILARASKVAAIACLAMTVFAMIGAAGFILTVGESLWRLLGWPSTGGDPTSAKKLWAVIVACAFGLPVLLRRINVQRYMEYVVGLCSVVAVLLFALAVLLRADVLSVLPKFLSAAFVPRGLGKLPELGPQQLTTIAVGFTYMGLGGWYCLFFPLWGRHRRVGVAGSRGDVGSGDAGAEEVCVAGDSPADAAAMRGWLRSIWIGTTGALAANAVTVGLTSLLAFGLLHGRGVTIGSNWDLLTEQAAFFQPTLGSIAPTIFLIAVVAFFADTWLATYASLAQMLSETLPRLSRRFRNIGEYGLFRPVFGVLFLLSLIPLFGSISPGELLLKWMGVAMFCSMPLIGGMLYYVNYRMIPSLGPAYYRPSLGARITLCLTTGVYLMATIVYLRNVL